MGDVSEDKDLDRKLSVVIPVRDRPAELKSCLASLAQQYQPPRFEVLIVDDGSRDPLPQSESWPFSVRILRQARLGIACARNLGLQYCTGDAVLFIDSDCIADFRLFERIEQGLDQYSQDVAFQLHLFSGSSGLAQAMEGLRLQGIQQVALQPNGHICYANTSGFVLRMSFVRQKSHLFEPGAIRGEDTLLLNQLYTENQVPRFLSNAIVRHCPQMVWWRYVWKHFSIGYRAGGARRQIASQHNKTLSGGKRLGMFSALRRIAAEQKLNWLTLPMTLFSYGLEVLGRGLDRMVGMRPGRVRILSTVVDIVRAQEIIARLISAALHGDSLTACYVNAWSLVQAERDPEFARILNDFDLVYADGVGASMTALLTQHLRVKKVTASIFYPDLFCELALRKVTVALVGGREGVTHAVCRKLQLEMPTLRVIACASGYMDQAAESRFIEQIKRSRPQVVIVGMGQPLQEQWVLKHRGAFPTTSFLCVGGMFDLIISRHQSMRARTGRVGLEWLYRLLAEPRHTWRRYLLGIPSLAFYVLRQVLTRTPRLRPTV